MLLKNVPIIPQDDKHQNRTPFVCRTCLNTFTIEQVLLKRRGRFLKKTLNMTFYEQKTFKYRLYIQKLPLWF